MSNNKYSKKKAAAKTLPIAADEMRESLIQRYQIPDKWPAAVDSEAATINAFPSQQDYQRHDLRHLPFVTIDGDDSKDFDDAVCCEKDKNGGWRLWVAIADVAAFVQEDSAIDIEACKRGNSVYFHHHVIPMLPEVLSNQWCSLVAHQQRWVVVVELHIDKKGQLHHSQFCRATIQTVARLTYQYVSDVLSETMVDSPKQPHQDLLQQLLALYQVLALARKKRHALDFDFVAPRLIFAKQQIKAIDIEPRLIAHRMIEEYMLLANVAAAKVLIQAKWPGPFRAHHPPAQEKWDEMLQTLKAYGVKLPFFSRKPSNKLMVRLLAKVADLSDHRLLGYSILRSLSQAYYTTEAHAHFGLDYQHYCHFTSPIRRYADLMVHRALLHILKLDGSAHSQAKLSITRQNELCTNISAFERRADEATRALQQYYICCLLRESLGQEFIAKITHVTHFGLFAHLDGFFIEGLVHISALGQEYFQYDKEQNALIGQNSGKIFCCGLKIKVRLVRVDEQARHVDLQLLN